MEQTDPPAKVASNDQLGPNALAYARARVSLLGSQEHMDTLNRALDALDGLLGAALIGGWTFKGFTAWAQGLEAELAKLRPRCARCGYTMCHVDCGYEDYEPLARDEPQKTLLPSVHGVYCCAENPNALTVVFKRRPTDDELRNLHDLVRAHGGPNV